jgi:hypothetical protein
MKKARVFVLGKPLQLSLIFAGKFGGMLLTLKVTNGKEKSFITLISGAKFIKLFLLSSP